MDWKLLAGYSHEDKELWDEFAKAFSDTYMDIAEGIKAERELQMLHMKDGDIDTYIATFKELLKAAGYTKNEQGALKMFKTRLPGGLNIRIINQSLTLPDTLEGWIESARQQELKYLQSKEFSQKGGLSPQALAFTKRLGIRTNNQRRHDPNAMDVDARNIGNRPRFTQLSNKEKQKL